METRVETRPPSMCLVCAQQHYNLLLLRYSYSYTNMRWGEGGEGAKATELNGQVQSQRAQPFAL